MRSSKGSLKRLRAKPGSTLPERRTRTMVFLTAPLMDNGLNQCTGSHQSATIISPRHLAALTQRLLVRPPAIIQFSFPSFNPSILRHYEKIMCTSGFSLRRSSSCHIESSGGSLDSLTEIALWAPKNRGVAKTYTQLTVSHPFGRNQKPDMR